MPQQSTIAATQAILQPLGLWNQTSLNWARQNQQRLFDLATILVGQLKAAGTVIQPPDIVSDPYLAINEAQRLWKKRDWIEIAEYYPKILHSLTGYLGYEQPIVFAYASKQGYAAAVHMERRGKWFTFNETGYFTSHSEYYQGDDDISLDYFPAKIKRGEVIPLDVVSSDLAMVLKTATGGDVNLLDRAEWRPVSLAYADLGTNGFHARIVGNPEMGGLVGYWNFESTYLESHIGAGVMIDRDVMGYAELEIKGKTPKLSVLGVEETNLYASLTLAASGLSHKMFLQGDFRIVPEVFWDFTMQEARVRIYGGGTFAAAPGGEADIENPNIQINHIRTHIGAQVRCPITDTLSVEFEVVGEFSKLYSKGSATAGIAGESFRASFEVEIKNDKYMVGGSLIVGPCFLQALTSKEETKAVAGLRYEI